MNRAKHKLDLPARKLSIQDLVKCKPKSDASARDGLDNWTLRLNDAKSLSVGMVWLQGLVVEVDIEADSFLLDDNTGIAEVVQVSCIQGEASWIKAGSYCMLIGELQSLNTGMACVKAVKVTNLTDKELHKEIWKYEVEYHRQYYQGILKK